MEEKNTENILKIIIGVLIILVLALSALAGYLLFSKTTRGNKSRNNPVVEEEVLFITEDDKKELYSWIEALEYEGFLAEYGSYNLDSVVGILPALVRGGLIKGKSEVTTSDPEGLLQYSMEAGTYPLYTVPIEEASWVMRNVFDIENATQDELKNYYKIYYEINQSFAYANQDNLYIFWDGEHGDESFLGEWNESVREIINEEENNISVRVRHLQDGKETEVPDYYVKARLAEKEGKRIWNIVYAGNLQPDEQESLEDGNYGLAYKMILQSYLNDTDFYVLVKYLLSDLNGDDIPELLVMDSDVHAGSVYLYTFSNDKVHYLGSFGAFGEIQYCQENKQLLSSYFGMGSGAYDIYILKGTYMESVHSLNAEIDPNDNYSNCLADGKEISFEEFERLRTEWIESQGFESLGYNSDDAIDLTSHNILLSFPDS